MSRAEDIFQKLIYFGEDALDEFIMNMQTEELFLDFKTAMSDGKHFKTLHKDDKELASWNCLMIAALARSCILLGKDEETGLTI